MKRTKETYLKTPTKTVQKMIILHGISILLSLNNPFPAASAGSGKWQEKSIETSRMPVKSVQRQTVRVVFWNVENLYDIYDDTTKLDNEFTSQGMMRWNYSRFKLKLNHTAKTLLAAGRWEPPGIIGLCEVENRYVMNKLIYESPMKPFGYRMIHHESPDLRGIDVALLYRAEVFSVLHSRPYRIRFPFDTAAQTREILLVFGKLKSGDSLWLLINHWPSRRGGYLSSQPRRDYVARSLRHIVDSLLSAHPLAPVLIMGDFNDEPSSASIKEILRSVHPDSARSDTDLRNLMAVFKGDAGTHRFRGIWNILDQFMVSASLMRMENPVHVKPGSTGIFRDSFLMKEDLKYFGKKPSRTFNGLRYEGGFSDHLPVFLDIEF